MSTSRRIIILLLVNKLKKIERDNMEFNIHQNIFDNYDGYSEEVEQYHDQLVALFNASPEAQILEDEGITANWTSMLLEYELSYLGITPPQMTKSFLQELLLEIIPRKVSAPAEDAPEIIREMQLFWTFLGREFHLKNAADCLKVLDKKMALKMQREMGNPANFGMAKSFVMAGMERGVDMTNQEEVDQWMNTYNAELLNSPRRLSRPKFDPSSIVIVDEEGPINRGSANPSSRRSLSPSGRRSSTDKTKRKMAKNSRKQNRKR
jgi:hypothetical protein